MSSMLSAPAAMRAIRDESFRPALAPLSVGTLIRSSASFRSPALLASPISGTRPAAPRDWAHQTSRTPPGGCEKLHLPDALLDWRYGPSASPILLVQRGILAFADPQPVGGSRLRPRRLRVRPDGGVTLWPSLADVGKLRGREIVARGSAVALAQWSRPRRRL